MNTVAGSYIFTCWLFTKVVLSDPHLVRQMQTIQALQELNAKLQALQEEMK